MTMKLFIFIALVTATLADSRADARECSTFWMGYHGSTVTAEDVRVIDAALPCSNIVASFPGTPEQALSFVNINGTLDSGMFSVISRRNEVEMNCRTGYYDRMLAGDRDQLLSAAIDRFVQLRRDFGVARERIRREQASRERIIRNAGGDAIDRRSATMGNSLISDMQVENARAQILAGVPFGFESSVAEALLDLDEQLPQDFYNDSAAVARFEEKYRSAIAATRARYNAGARYMNGRFRTMYVRNPTTGQQVATGGYYEANDDTWTAFAQAGSFEDLAASLQAQANRPINAQAAHRMVCTLEMRHGAGRDDAETATTTALGVGALATGPAAPFIEAGIAAYYAKNMVQQCFLTPDIDVVRGQSCVESGTLEGAIESANANRCAQSAIPVIAGAGGAALTFKATWQIVRNADGTISGLRPAGALPEGVVARRASTRVAGPEDVAGEENVIEVTAQLTRGQWRTRGQGLAERLSTGNRTQVLSDAGYAARSGAPDGFQKYCTASNFCLTLPRDARPLTRSQRNDLVDAYARRASGNREWVHPDARGRALARFEDAPPPRAGGAPAGAVDRPVATVRTAEDGSQVIVATGRDDVAALSSNLYEGINRTGTSTLRSGSTEYPQALGEAWLPGTSVTKSSAVSEFPSTNLGSVERVSTVQTRQTMATRLQEFRERARANGYSPVDPDGKLSEFAQPDARMRESLPDIVGREVIGFDDNPATQQAIFFSGRVRQVFQTNDGQAFALVRTSSGDVTVPINGTNWDGPGLSNLMVRDLRNVTPESAGGSRVTSTASDVPRGNGNSVAPPLERGSASSRVASSESAGGSSSVRTSASTADAPMPALTAARRAEIRAKYRLELNSVGRGSDDLMPMIAELERRGLDDATIRSALTQCQVR